MLIRLVRSGALLLIAMFSLAVLHAKDGRDFAGFYSLTNIQETGDSVQITLNLQLFNYSESDLRGATVSLFPAAPLSEALGAFPAVSTWRAGKYVVLHQQFTLSRAELESWHDGSQPAIRINYTDASGQACDRTAQLTRRPSVPF